MTVNVNDGDDAAFIKVSCGVWNPQAAVDVSEVPAAVGPAEAPWHFSTDLSEQPANAVRVRAQVEVPTLMPFMQPRRVWAHAVASQDEPMAGFSIGSGLASLDDGVLNQVLGGLLGTSVSLDLVSYQGLATTSISVLEFLE